MREDWEARPAADAVRLLFSFFRCLSASAFQADVVGGLMDDDKELLTPARPRAAVLAEFRDRCWCRCRPDEQLRPGGPALGQGRLQQIQRNTNSKEA